MARKKPTRARSAARTRTRKAAPRKRSSRGAHLDAEAAPVGADRSQQASAARELSWSDFDARVQALAAKVQKSFKPDAVVGIAHGGVFVGGALASALARDFFPVRISRRSRDTVLASPRLAGSMPPELAGRRVLIVDDIASSGDTLELASQLAKSAGAKQIATAALVSRPGGFRPDFHAEHSKDFFVFPWDYQAVAQDSRFGDPDKAGA
jgi:uncharacterized protein